MFDHSYRREVVFFLMFKQNFLWLFVTTASCPVTRKQWEEPGSIFFTLSYQVFWAEWKDHLSWPADNVFSDAAQDAISLPRYKGSLLVRVQLVFHQDPQFFFCKAAFQTVNSMRFWWPICPDSWGPSELPSSHPMYQTTLASFALSAILLRLHSVLLPTLLMEVLSSIGNSSSARPPAGLCATHQNPLNLAVQPVFSPHHCPLIQLVVHQLIYGAFMRDCFESLAKIKVNNICCSLFIRCHFIAGGYRWLGTISPL